MIPLNISARHYKSIRGRLLSLLLAVVIVMTGDLPVRAQSAAINFNDFCRILPDAAPEVVSEYLERATFDLNQRCPDSYSMLRFTARTDDGRGELPLALALAPTNFSIERRELGLKIAERLLAKGAKLDLYLDNGYPLYLSIWSEYSKDRTALEFLNLARRFNVSSGIRVRSLGAGADISVNYTPFDDPTGWNALMILSTSDSLERSLERKEWLKPDEYQTLVSLFSMLLASLNIEEQDAYGRTALHLAVDRGYHEIAKFLVESGASVTAKDGAGLTPIDYALSRGDASLLTFLKSSSNAHTDILPQKTLNAVTHNEGRELSIFEAFSALTKQLSAPSPNSDANTGEKFNESTSVPPRFPGSSTTRPSQQSSYDDAIEAIRVGESLKARSILSTLAEQDDSASQFRLGRMAANGEGGPRDLVKARELFTKAAARGHALATFNVGLMWLRGDGGPADKTIARQYLKRAALFSETAEKARTILRNLSN